jgi:hypothetical protein|eukprot:SAG25_NODE_149_length_13742_cov_17.202155_6_plen_60_part_00
MRRQKLDPAYVGPIEIPAKKREGPHQRVLLHIHNIHVARSVRRTVHTWDSRLDVRLHPR